MSMTAAVIVLAAAGSISLALCYRAIAWSRSAGDWFPSLRRWPWAWSAACHLFHGVAAAAFAVTLVPMTVSIAGVFMLTGGPALIGTTMLCCKAASAIKRRSEDGGFGRIEWLFPLRGRWLRYFLTTMAMLGLFPTLLISLYLVSLAVFYVGLACTHEVVAALTS